MATTIRQWVPATPDIFDAARAQFDRIADHGDMSLRDAAYIIAVDRVAKACRARGWV
jgi:glutamate dehydrogenase/leucine dehydrogenase